MAGSDGLQVLLVAPTGRDAGLIEDALKSSGLQSQALKDVAHAAGIFHGTDVGALLVAEEALGTAEIALLASALRDQPSWSALPVLILTMGGKETIHSRSREQRRLMLGNTTLLERPIRAATLVSSVKSALKALCRPAAASTSASSPKLLCGKATNLPPWAALPPALLMRSTIRSRR
jgi:hypothetical protein